MKPGATLLGINLVWAGEAYALWSGELKDCRGVSLNEGANGALYLQARCPESGSTLPERKNHPQQAAPTKKPGAATTTPKVLWVCSRIDLGKCYGFDGEAGIKSKEEYPDGSDFGEGCRDPILNGNTLQCTYTADGKTRQEAVEIKKDIKPLKGRLVCAGNLAESCLIGEDGSAAAPVDTGLVGAVAAGALLWNLKL